MANTFNEDFQRALSSKLALQESERAKNVAQAEAIPLTTQSLIGEKESAARAADIAANLGIAQFQQGIEAPIADYNFGADLTSKGAFSFYNPRKPLGKYPGITQTLDMEQFNRGYAGGGVVANTDDPLMGDYELYRRVAAAVGLPTISPAQAIPRIAQLRAQARQQLFKQLTQGGTTPGFAGGGAVEFDGPGTGKSDSIPALIDGAQPGAVSDGEIRIPKHIVEYYGTKFFDSLVLKARQAQRGKERSGA